MKETRAPGCEKERVVEKRRPLATILLSCLCLCSICTTCWPYLMRFVVLVCCVFVVSAGPREVKQKGTREKTP